MEYHSDLYGALKQHKVEEALYITGDLIYTKQIELLEQTWIRAIATLGEYTNVCFPKLHETCKEIVAILHTEEFHVKEAFLITTRICILYMNSVQYVAFPKLTIPQLRTKVIDVFSDSIKLSETGKQKFQMILPKPSNENEFCLKIISGLVKVWSQKESLRFREALEYVCRKDYVIESIPSETESNITSFLWDFMKIFQKDLTEPFYMLYKYGFKKKEKSWRNCFLYALHNYLHEHYGSLSWSEYEKNILHKTDLVTEELWKYIVSVHQDTQAQEESTTDTYDKVSIFENYYPKALYDFTTPCQYDVPKEQIKCISVKKKKSKLLVDSSKEKENPYSKGYFSYP